jgi:enoyl-CoA hydratase/carnithine racemase
MGVSLQRSLLCDIRVAAEGTRLRLPETTHGVIPDNGGVSALFQICGAGLVSDMVLTGRVVSAEEALTHGIVSRVVAEAELESTVYDMAEQIAQAPRFTIMMARDTIRNLSVPVRRASMINELANQTLTTQSDDYAEFRAARAEGRQPCFTGR